jgi:hypothetical protein
LDRLLFGGVGDAVAARDQLPYLMLNLFLFGLGLLGLLPMYYRPYTRLCYQENEATPQSSQSTQRNK